MKTRTIRLLTFTGGSLLALTATPALAQNADEDKDTVPDITITAQKFESTVQDTPIAISVVSGDAIQKEGRSKLDDVLVNEPGVVVQGVARGFQASIRGLGLNLPPQNGAGAVANNYDGIYSSRAESTSAGFYDLERVEVLRGPQSTIYGRNAVGGVVNVISRDPELEKFGGYVQGEVGNYSNFRGEGALNAPLGDAVALRVAVAGVSRDGYISNGRDDNKAVAGRVKLLIEPNDSLRALFGIERTQLRGKGPGTVPIAAFNTGSRVTTDPAQGFQRANSMKYWAQLEANIGPGRLFVLPSYQTTKGLVQGAFGGNFANNYDPLYTDQFQVEARYGSKAGAKVQWNVGYYHYNNDGASLGVSGSCVLNGQVLVPAAGFSNVGNGPPGACQATAYRTVYSPDIRKINSDAVFGQVVVPLGDAFKITLGARNTWEQASGITDLNSGNTCGAAGFNPGCAVPNTPLTTTAIRTLPTIKSSYFDYKGGVDFDIGENSMLYASISSGHRQAGYGFAPPGALPGSYKTEKMTAYEAGIKNKLAGGALLLNAGAFYYDYSRYQLVVANFTGFPPIINIFTPPGRQFGAELETAWAITPADKLTGSIVHLSSKIKNDGSPAGIAFGDQPFTNTPKWQFKGSYSHEFDLGSAGSLTPRIDVRHLSSQVVFARQNVPIDSPADQAAKTQKSYFTGDLFLNWSSENDRISISAYLKNFNDKLVKTSSFFGYAQVLAPRTVGLIANIKF